MILISILKKQHSYNYDCKNGVSQFEILLFLNLNTLLLPTNNFLTIRILIPILKSLFKYYFAFLITFY